MDNAHRMKQAMFFDPSIDWSQFDPVHVLVLRACAPKQVFARENKTAYLTQVGGNEGLSDIADALFADDYAFANAIPELRSHLVTLMLLAYELGIRPADSRVTIKMRA